MLTSLDSCPSSPSEPCSSSSCATEDLPDDEDQASLINLIPRCTILTQSIVQTMEIPAALLHAPEKERMMITYVCEAYENLQLQRAAEEQLYRRLLLEAEEHRRITETKSTTAKSIKQEAKLLVSLALQGLSRSKLQYTSLPEPYPLVPLSLLRCGLENPSNGTTFFQMHNTFLTTINAARS
jgi:hypothetical protein